LSIAGLLAGHFAVALRRAEPRPGELAVSRDDWELTRSQSDPLLVTEAAWLELPTLREDFDLRADVELEEGAELDLVMRRVEPRPLQGVSLPAQSRFCALRLSTIAVGEPWRKPESALFGEPGGLKLGGGLPATIVLQARGRTLTGNVAGKQLPTAEAQDDHGSLVLIARGGTVAIRMLHVLPVDRSLGLDARWLGLASGVVLGAMCAWRRRGIVRALLACAALLSAPSAFLLVAPGALLPLSQTDCLDEWLAASSGVPLALAVLASGGSRILIALSLAMGSAASFFALAECVQGIRDRFPPTPQLDAVFGEGARETVTETLARRIRGPNAIHVPSAPLPGQSRVFLLGGQLMWRRGAAPDDHVEPLLLGELRGPDPRRPAVEPISLPTVDGWSSQQWGMFDRFFRGYLPAVVVFGVPRYEDAALADGSPRSTPESLRTTIAAARSGCAAIGAKLVLVADAGLPEPFAQALRSEQDAGMPLVELTENDAASGIARKLAETLRPMLQR
ncbi:MAG: hypothetical protein RIT24_3001, partial [Planctomycetota bacterium]